MGEKLNEVKCPYKFGRNKEIIIYKNIEYKKALFVEKNKRKIFKGSTNQIFEKNDLVRRLHYKSKKSTNKILITLLELLFLVNSFYLISSDSSIIIETYNTEINDFFPILYFKNIGKPLEISIAHNQMENFEYKFEDDNYLYIKSNSNHCTIKLIWELSNPAQQEINTNEIFSKITTYETDIAISEENTKQKETSTIFYETSTSNLISVAESLLDTGSTSEIGSITNKETITTTYSINDIKSTSEESNKNTELISNIRLLSETKINTDLISDSETFSGNLLKQEYTTDEIITSNVLLNAESLFKGCSKIISIDFYDYNTSLMYNISHMFDSCISLTEIKDFYPINAEDMSYLFNNCTSLNNFSFNANEYFNYSKVMKMEFMFSNSSNINMINFNKYRY